MLANAALCAAGLALLLTLTLPLSVWLGFRHMQPPSISLALAPDRSVRTGRRGARLEPLRLWPLCVSVRVPDASGQHRPFLIFRDEMPARQWRRLMARFRQAD